jgi:hypothetical protein
MFLYQAIIHTMAGTGFQLIFEAMFGLECWQLYTSEQRVHGDIGAVLIEC